MRVLALPKYGTQSASTRQRFVQYEPYLARAGISVEYLPLLDNDHLTRLVEGRPSGPLSALAAYARRARRIVGPRDFDVLWVHCEFFPYLPGAAERLAAIAGGRPILFDFDDAIFHMYDANPRPLIRRLLGKKLAPLLRRAAACCCGNAYLQRYVSQYCPSSWVLPTVVDTDKYVPLEREISGSDPVTVGWIGSPSTWAYVRPLLPMLSELARGENMKVRVIGAGAKAEADRFPGLDLVDWQEDEEIGEVQHMDVGIMPIIDEPWARGKSGYKLIQYMACGLPVVASPVGVNCEIVDHGVNGFLATEPDEWRSALLRLIGDVSLRKEMGAAGRQRAKERYSLQVTAPQLIEIFEGIGPGNSVRAA